MMHDLEIIKKMAERSRAFVRATLQKWEAS